MFDKLKQINTRPEPFEFYTASELWTDEHTAKQMLAYHLNDSLDVSSRNNNFIEQSVNWIVSRFDIGSETAVADFGCGPGFYTTRLAEQGAAVTGVDFSANSLNYAKQVATEKGLEINYINMNYLDFESCQRFDLITMIMCDFCALSPGQRKIMLDKFHCLLNPGGSVLLDVYSLNSFNQKAEAASYELNQLNGFWSPDDYYCFVNTFKYDDVKVILDKYTIIEKKRERIVYNWLQYFDRESLQKEFVEAGFSVDSLYSNVAGAVFDPKSTEIAIIARR